MKLKHLLIILMLGAFPVYIFAQSQGDNPEDFDNMRPHTILPAELTSITTTDNENNALTGTPDGDMDVYLFNNSSIVPIEFNIYVSDPTITSAQLSILAWDIDWSSGERDAVYLNGNFIGYLTGANQTWSTSAFGLNPLYVNAESNNLVRIEVDILNSSPVWAVTVDWGQLVINGGGALAHFRYVTLNKTNYSPGETMIVNEEADADIPIYCRFETNLLDPDDNILVANFDYRTVTNGNEPVVEYPVIPATAVGGAYKIQAILYDHYANTQQDIRYVPFTVLGCVDPTYGGEIGYAQSNCGPFNPVEISNLALPTGHNGNLEYMWQFSYDNVTYFDIASTNSLTYDPGYISIPVYYRRLARVDCSTDWSGAAASNVLLMDVYPEPIVDAGIDEQIYIGYPPYEVQLNAAAGWAGSYSWSPTDGLSNSCISNPIASPSETTTYTVTFTDANGCTSTDEITVHVMDVRCGLNMDKVLVCHIPPDNPDNPHTICIGFAAVADHLSHGDYLGECMDDKVMKLSEVDKSIILNVYPNPIENNCTIEIELYDPSFVNIYITDITGKKASTIFNGELTGGSHHFSWENTIGLSKGMYFLTVTTNDEVISQKLLLR